MNPVISKPLRRNFIITTNNLELQAVQIITQVMEDFRPERQAQILKSIVLLMGLEA